MTNILYLFHKNTILLFYKRIKQGEFYGNTA